ncbi:complement C1r subcomponent-like [Lissotriton helveticus]
MRRRPLPIHSMFLVWVFFFLLHSSSKAVNIKPQTKIGKISYLINQKCPESPSCNQTWHLNVAHGYQIKLHFTYFDIGRNEDVCQEYVKVMDGWNPSIILCGKQNVPSGQETQAPMVYFSSSNTMTVIFQSSNQQREHMGGFSAYYTAVDIDECAFRNGRCSQFCHNYPGGFSCSCDVGYFLKEDNRTCEEQVVSCMTPQELTNGVYKYQTSPDVSTYGAVIKYECNEPYYRMVARTGDGQYTCTAEGRWKDHLGSEGIPQCLPVCGNPKHPVEHTGRIIGGDKARAGNFPWQVYLTTPAVGAGALISDRWILTAAQLLVFKEDGNTEKKVSDVADVNVFMGDINRHTQIELAPYPVQSIFFHPNFIRVDHNFDNDIALIKLSESVPMSADIMPICLPWKNSSQAVNEDGHLGYVSGFGVTENYTISSHLRYARLLVASNDECKDFLKGKNVGGEPPVFSDNMFCAGLRPDGRRRNKDSCQGDSGGAFTVWDQEAKRWVATGIVSWGISCGHGYGFYTKVNNYRQWMEEVMKGEPPVL